MQTAEISRRYIDFFSKHGHTVVPSASLVSEDPTVMFTIAGMVPFVPYLTGVVPAPYSRAVDVQKCIRTNDIEEVGKTARHGTFFQMLGNWSFGDYFKAGAIEYAWTLLTAAEADGGLGFDERDLWVTVFETDDEAFALWKKIAGLPDQRIQRMGREDNFWHTGRPGPGGPCSEIYFDRGARYGRDGGPAVDDNRFTEIWNLVFMQDLLSEVRTKVDFDIAGALPQKNIDTGMGLERVAFIKQGVDNMYEIDQVRPVLDSAAGLSGKRYGADHADDVRMRIIADHVRSSLMLMSDGVTPTNEGRGYILRRLLRRSIRAMRLLGVDEPTFSHLFQASRDAMQITYPEVAKQYARIEQLALGEEETFLRTLAAGTSILDVAVAKTTKTGSKQIAGDAAFLLHDTYGFPIELTLEMAAEAGLSVDRQAFDVLMKEQRSRAKADAKSKKQVLADVSVYADYRAMGETVFTGYTEVETESKVLGILVAGNPAKRAKTGEIAEIILAETALYAESGGQAPDRGKITGNGFELRVLDVQRPVKGIISHTVEVLAGEVAVGATAVSEVDTEYRRGATQAHSGTHIVHAALRQVLGQQAQQAGSFNKAGYLRLDFSWNNALSVETRTEIEEIANNAIRENFPVITREMKLSEAKQLGAMALFGEKYGEVVRVVDIDGPWSRELCAGTHVTSSAEIGMINLISESSVGANNRRIESLVGIEAFRQLAIERTLVQELTATLKTQPENLVDRIGELLQSLKTAEKRIAQYESAALQGRVPMLVNNANKVGGYLLVTETLGSLGGVDELRSLAAAVREKLGSVPSIIALAAEVANKPVVIVAVSAQARAQGANAGQLAKAAATVLGGGGGGKPDMAQGGGQNVSAIPQALSEIRDGVAELQTMSGS